MINNTQTTRAWKTRFIHAKDFASVGNIVADGPGFIQANLDNDQQLENVMSTGVLGILCDAGGLYRTWLPVFPDIDTRFPVVGRVHWTCDSANVADTATFILNYRITSMNDLGWPAVNVAAHPALGADTNLGATYHQVTGAGLMDASGLTDGTILHLQVESDALPANATVTYFMGLELLYASKAEVGNPTGVQIEDPPQSWL